MICQVSPHLVRVSYKFCPFQRLLLLALSFIHESVRVPLEDFTTESPLQSSLVYITVNAQYGVGVINVEGKLIEWKVTFAG